MKFPPPLRSALLFMGRAVGTQYWLRLGIRYRCIRLLLRIAPPGSFPFEVPFFGLRYRGSLASHIDREVYFYGSYERYVLLLLRELARKTESGVFVDVGANVGHHTLFMAPLCYQVHSFEPYGPVRRELEKALSYNHLSNVRVHPVGLGTEEEDLPFYAPMGSNLGVGSFVEEEQRDRIDLIPSGTLPVVQGDRYFKNHGIEQVDILKIDVEGFEAKVLEGLKQTLERSRPYIIMEFSSATRASYDSAESFLSNLPKGYEAYTIRGDRPLLFVFNTDGYMLRPFDFSYTKGNIFLAPAEKMKTWRL